MLHLLNAVEQRLHEAADNVYSVLREPQAKLAQRERPVANTGCSKDRVGESRYHSNRTDFARSAQFLRAAVDYVNFDRRRFVHPCDFESVEVTFQCSTVFESHLRGKGCTN